MKAICSWLFFGVVVAGLIADAAPLRAQPASEPPATDGELTTSDDEAASTDGVPVPTDGVPAPTSAVPAPTGGGTIAIHVQNKPWGQGISMKNRNAARALFLEGNRLFRIPLFAKAAEKYVAALDHWKHPVIYLNLAIAQLNAGQEVEARESLEHSLQYGEEPLGAENFQGARLQLSMVTRQLGRVRVTCRTPGAQVTLDGIPLFIGPGSYEGWVKAKDHELTAKKPEYLSEARRITVVPGKLQAIELRLITLSEAADASRRWAVWKPWSAVVAGGTILAAGGVLHALAFKNLKANDRNIVALCGSVGSVGCKGDNPELLEFHGRLRHVRQQQQLAIGGYVVGGSLACAGIVLLYMNRPRIGEQSFESSGTNNIAITPAMSNDMLGVLVNISR